MCVCDFIPRGGSSCSCVCLCVWKHEREREKKRDGKRDAESIDVCLHHVADRGGSVETDGLFIPSVCLYVCFDRLSYLRSKLRNSPGDGGRGGGQMLSPAPFCARVCVCVCVCATVNLSQYKWRVLTNFLIGREEQIRGPSLIQAAWPGQGEPQQFTQRVTATQTQVRCSACPKTERLTSTSLIKD